MSTQRKNHAKQEKRASGARKVRTRRPVLRVGVILLVKPRGRVPAWWPDTDGGYVTAASDKQGNFRGWSAGIQFDRAIDPRFADDLARGWIDANGSGFNLQFATIQGVGK